MAGLYAVCRGLAFFMWNTCSLVIGIARAIRKDDYM